MSFSNHIISKVKKEAPKPKPAKKAPAKKAPAKKVAPKPVKAASPEPEEKKEE